MTKLANQQVSQQSSASQHSKPIKSIKEDDFDKITHLNTHSNSNSNSNCSDAEIDHDLSNEETGDFATIAIQEQNQQTSNNLDKNISNFNKIKKSINEKQLYLSSCLLNDACSGLPSECNNDSKSLYLYSIYRHFYLQYLLYILIVLHHSLAFFEELGFSREHAKYDSLTITIEAICITYYAIRLAIRASFLPSYRFYSDVKNLLLLLLIFVTLIDVITYLTIPARYAYRWSIVLRPFFVLNFAENRILRRLIRNIRNTLPDLLNVLTLLLISISVFSLIAIKLFKDVEFRSPNQIKAKNYFDFYYFLYVLVTTANNPDLMMPAYHQSKWYSLFFIIFFILNLYLFCNVILAVIYNNFRKHIKNEVRNMLDTRKTSLIKSFEVMVRNNCMNLNEAIPVFNENEGLNSDQFKMLMQTYFTCWKVPTNVSTIRFRKDSSANSNNYLIKVYWKLLESNSLITWTEYQNIIDLLNMNMKVIDLDKLKNEANDVKFPKLYNSVLSKLLIKLVKSKYFRYFFDTIIFLNSVHVAFDFGYFQQVELIILFLFMIEIWMKIYTFNLKNFLNKYWNIFDTLVISSSFILIAIGLLFNLKSITNYGELIIILRVLRLSKWLKKIDRFNLVVRTIINILPYISLYSILMFLLFYAFSIIGMQLFRNLITPEIINNDCTITKTILNRTSSISITSSIKMRYCDLNFNTLPSSFVVLFDMMVVNQWHQIADNFEIVAGTKFTRLYFVTFHLICVIVLLNFFTAFVLEAFILEYINGTGQANSEQNKDLKKKITQLGIDCKSSILNLVSASTGLQTSINEFDQLDADHDLHFEFSSFKQNEFNEDNNLDGMIKQNFSVISLSPDSNLRVLIKENRTVEELLLRMFRDELSKKI